MIQLWNNRLTKGNFAFLAALSLLSLGCGNRHPQEVIATKDLRVVVASSRGNSAGGHSLVVVVENKGTEILDLLGVRLMKSDGTSIKSSFPGPRFSCPQVAPNQCEYAVLNHLPRGILEGGQVRVDVETSQGRRYATKALPAATIASSVACSSDHRRITMHALVEKGLGADATCRVNGQPANHVSTSSFDTAGDGRLIVVEIEPNQKITPGQRIVVELSLDGEATHVGIAKAFPAFVCGKTSFQRILRAVSIEHAPDWMTVNLYNEADYRKAPVSIKAVAVDGKEVTHLCRLPSGAIPPDRHQYEQDLRPLGIPYTATDKNANKHRVDIRYKRLHPQRSGPIPDDFFETLTCSFVIQKGVHRPLEYEGGFGVAGGVCIADASRPLPPKEDVLGDSQKTLATDSSIPVFACLPDTLDEAELHKYARYCDFLVLDQYSSQGMDAMIAAKLIEMNLPTPWAAAFNIWKDAPAQQGDIERLGWSTIGMGGRGVLLGVSDEGEIGFVANRNAIVSRVLDKIKRLHPLLETSFPLSLKSECNQGGVRLYFLACGTENLLMIAINDWCSQANPFRRLPSCFATRLGVNVRFTHGANWVPRHAQDPVTGKRIQVTVKNDGSSVVDLPMFDAAQVVWLTRNASAAVDQVKAKAPKPVPSIAFSASPVVSLGTVRPGSVHQVKVPIRSLVKDAIELVLEDAPNDAFQPGEYIADPVHVPANDDAVIAIDYTAPHSRGESVTSLRFSSPDGGITLSVYVCADVQNPADLSPARIDYGSVVLGRIPVSTRIKLVSQDSTARIEEVVPDSDWVQGINIAGDGRSFELTLAAIRDLGWRTSEIALGIRLNDSTELYKGSVSVRVHTTPAVFSIPKNLVVTPRGGAKRFTLRVRHADGNPICITNLSHSKAKTILKRADNRFATVQVVEVELPTEIGREDLAPIQIGGRSKNGEPFRIEVPISVVGSPRDAQSSNAGSEGEKE